MSHGLSQLHKFVSPGVIFDTGCRHSVAGYVRTFSTRKALLVSDPGMLATDWIIDIQVSLEGRGVDYYLYTDVSPNPRVDEAMLGAGFYRSEDCNAIIAVDGGSPMDCTKGIGIVTAHGHSILKFEGVGRLQVPSPSLILIPTTAGTLADVPQFVITSNQDERMRFSVMSRAVMPDVSLIDPKATLTVDPFLSACTGIDALVHAIEAFVSTGHGPLIGPHALEAVRLIDGNLVRMIANPGSIALCEEIMLGNMQARLAFPNAIPDAVHAISHSLGGCLDLPHDLCSAALVEHVMTLNYSTAPERFKAIAETFGIDRRGLTQGQVRQHLVDHLIAFKHVVDFHKSLTLYGVDSPDIPFLSRHMMQDPYILTNPRGSNQRDVEVVYDEAL